MRRTSYQQGSLKLADRKKGKVWEFRWREVQVDGSTRRKNIVIGTLREFANESAAQTAVDARKHGYERSRSCEIARNLLSGPNWTMKENGDFAEVLYFVGVPDGI